jgi:hypothetical protein
MNYLCRRRSAVLIVFLGLLFMVFSVEPALSSPFFGSDPTAQQIMSGTPYAMNDPSWLIGGKQNRSVFAYKVFSALFMLGYQTETFQGGGDQVNAYKAFQTRNGLPATGVVDAAGLALLDQQLVSRAGIVCYCVRLPDL